MKNDTKKAGTSPKGRRKLNFVEKKEKLPLNGKSIFVDVKEKPQSRSITEDIKRLGARVDEFFHKDINYVITNNRTSKPDKHESFQSPESPSVVSTPSPFNCGPSPSPASGPIPPPESVTRGKAIAKRAVTKETNPVLTNAENWGIKIVTLDVALKWIQREISKLPPVNTNVKTKGSSLRGSYKVKKLKSPYLKIESTTRQYKVVYQQVDLWPHANVETPRGTCPFDGTSLGGERSREERGDRIGLIPLEPTRTPNTKSKHKESNKTLESSKSSQKKRLNSSIVGGVRIVTAGELRRRKEMKRLQEKKKGYCECCEIKYDNLTKHVTEEQHREFIREKKHYQALDSLISSGPNEATFLQRVLQQHCSIVSGSQSKEEKVRKETAVKSTPRKLQNSSKKTTIKIVNSEVQRRSSRSPKEIWRKANENDQSKLLKDNMEQEIRKSRQVRRSAEIDMQLDKHYVPARTRNFLFIQGPPSQACETKVLGQSDVKSTCSLEKRNEADKDSEKSVNAEMENEACEGSVSVKRLKNNAEKNLEQSSRCFMHLRPLIRYEMAENDNRLIKNPSLTTPLVKTCKSPPKIEASLEQSPALPCNLRKKSQKSPQKKSKETETNGEECVLERRVETLKKPNVFVKSKGLDNEKISVMKSPRRSSRFQHANSEGKNTEETDENITKDETLDIIATEENLSNRVSEDIMPAGSANSKLPESLQEKVQMDEKNLHKSNKKKIGLHKTKKIEVDEKDIEKSSRECTNIEVVKTVQGKGKEEDITTQDAQNGDQICDARKTNVETCQNVVKCSLRLRKLKGCVSDKGLQDSSDSKKHAQNTREDADNIVDHMTLRRESSLRRKSSEKIGKNFTCDHADDHCVENDKTLLAIDKGLIREEETKGEQNNSSTSNDFELKNVDHSSQLSSKTLCSRDQDNISNEKSECQNICTTSPLTVDIPKDKDNSLDADVEKSLYYIDRVHRLRSTNQRQSIVDRELKDITTKVQERNSCSNSPSVYNAERQSSVGASPSCYSSPKKINNSTPQKNLTSNKVEQTTPIVTSPKSGLSITPRSNKRKRWNKRRNSKSIEAYCSTSKPRKLEKLKYPIAGKKTPEKLCGKESGRNSKSIVLSVGGDYSKGISYKNQSDLERQIRHEAVVKDSGTDNDISLVRTPMSKSPLRPSKCGTPRGMSSPLVWRNAKGSTPKGRKRIKLNGSWSVLSDRSVNKLLHDSDSESHFEGFEKGDLTRHSSLCSDASFVEIDEVELEENSDQEWEIEQEKAQENGDEIDVVDVLPGILSSPGKRSDSSWDTGFVDFIDTQFSNRKMSVTKSTCQEESIAEPLGSPLKRKRLESIPERFTENQLHRKKKRRKLDDDDEFQCFLISDKAAQIDEDIQFNFSSPNKRKTKGLKEKTKSRQRKSLDFKLSEKCVDVKQKRQKNCALSNRKETFRKQDKIENQELEKNLSPMIRDSGKNLNHIGVTKKEDSTLGTVSPKEKDLSKDNRKSRNFKLGKKHSADIVCLSPKNRRDAMQSSSPGSRKSLRSRKK